jgi:predicted O-linked N-acetylglucosamine transferase (SPINDLY family)
MNCVLADRFHVRPGEEPFYREKVIHMPGAYACYAPPADAPEVAQLPALANGFTTFGCLSNPAKLNPELISTWSQILLRVPASRLLLKFNGLNDRALQDDLLRRFAEHGISAQRISLEGESTHHEFLRSYNRVDIALDTQPYSGGLTTCEALWMGVPVITYPGKTFAGRHATSYLNRAGFPHFVVADRAAYIEDAVRWGSQPAALAALRPRVRQQVRQSPLCDAVSFARHFLALLQSEFAAINS